MQTDSVKNTLMVALGVCLVCSILVSAAAVSLGPIQSRNQRLDKIKNILEAGALEATPQTLEAIYSEKVSPVAVDLRSGEEVAVDKVPGLPSVAEFDIKTISDNPEMSFALTPEQDTPQIKRLPRYMYVYKVQENGQLNKIILPIHGKGLWSTLYGFLALDSDLETVKGITFYQHGETPGLGGEVDNAKWKASWNGKQALDEQGKVLIEVLKGKVDPARSGAGHQIDGLSGATITTRGVDALVQFWLGKNGYGPYLDNLRKENEDVN